ncbi:MAG: hypothetical protein IH944_10620 [Armatimonadetes bacterium]|nr:hypothetical protein [Armatimonadota bacterium]
MSSASGSGRMWTMVVITAAVAGLLGIGFQLNSPDITTENYELVGIDRVPESRFLARVGYFGFARWEDVPAEDSYVIWLNGELEWSNRFYDTDVKLPKIWLEDEDRKRVGRVFVKRTGDEESEAANLGIGITAEDLNSAASGHLVIARNRKEIARLPLANLVEMVDLPERPVVEFLAGSVVIKCTAYQSWARMTLTTDAFSSEPTGGAAGEYVFLRGQASFLPTGDEHTNEVWSLLMRDHEIAGVRLDNVPPVAEPMAIGLSGRLVHGTWARETIHIDATLVPARASGQEETLTVPRQSHSFVGASISLAGTSIRATEYPLAWDSERSDHQIEFSLEFSPLFTNDVEEFGAGYEKTLILVSPYGSMYYGPGVTYVSGESVLELSSVRGLIDACSHAANGFDIDVYTITPIKSSDFSVKLKPSF